MARNQSAAGSALRNLFVLVIWGAVSGNAAASETSPAPSAAPSVLPADRVVAWNPGMTSVGGIPNRTVIHQTLLPSGRDDSNAIQSALNSAPAGQVVMLSPGTFIVNKPLLIHSAVTLRGSGAGVTKLVKANGAKPRTSAVIRNTTNIFAPVSPEAYPHDTQPVIVVGPPRWRNGPSSALSKNLVIDGEKGSSRITLADASNFEVGMFVLLDELSGASWQPTPAGFPDSAKVWQGDRVAWNMHFPRQGRDDNAAAGLNGPYDVDAAVLPVAMRWFARVDRPISEIKQIIAISGNSITFSSPLTISYRTSHGAQLTPYIASPAVQNAGVEDLSILGGSDGALKFETAAYSWAKAVEVTEWIGEGVAFNNSFRVELRDSYVHTASWPEPDGSGYAISVARGSSEVLIENNILVDACKVMLFRSAGAGSVVAYNYADDSFDFDNPTWVEVGINASHMAGAHHVLFEGNLSHNADSDYTHGNAIYLTFFRNHLTGHRQSIVDQAGIRTVGLAYGSWWDSFVGNVLGRPGEMTGWSYEDPSMTSNTASWGQGGKGNIWMLGYDPERWEMAPDPKVLSTVVRGGNFDYLTNKAVWTRELPEQPLPASLYLQAKPAFFGEYHWPWVDPTGSTKLHTLPAKARFDAGTPFALAPGVTQ